MGRAYTLHMDSQDTMDFQTSYCKVGDPEPIVPLVFDFGTVHCNNITRQYFTATYDALLVKIGFRLMNGPFMTYPYLYPVFS